MNNEYDVVVMGAGIAGCMAAIAAARMGVKTLIVEQHGYPGGMLTAAGVGPMMTFHAGDKKVVQGITDELIDRLVKKKKSPGHLFDTTGYTYTVTPFDVEGMKSELEAMLLESGCEMLYHTMLAKVATNGNEITSVTVCNKAGLSQLEGKVFIDATGDGDLSAWAGVTTTYGRPEDGLAQAMTLKLRVNGVDVEKYKQFIREKGLKKDTSLLDKSPRLSIGAFAHIFKDAFESGEIAHLFRGLLIFEANNSGEFIINTTRIQGLNACDPWDLTKAEIEGRRQTSILADFIVKRLPGFENAKVLHTGPNIGIRSSRQIKGLYTLTAEDMQNCVTFDDVIAHTGYPVDIHPAKGTKSSKEYAHPKWGEVRSIPYRCLVNNQISNLVTVGRCISADYDAQGAIRTTPIVGAIGHAGGVGAALAVQKGLATQDISTRDLQKLLIEQGAYLEIANR